MTKKIGLVVGHNPIARGAVRATDGVAEFDFWSKVADEIKALNPGKFIVLYRSAAGGYNTEVSRVYSEANRLKVAATVELHFNSAAVQATGTETLTSGTVNSMRLCGVLQEYMVDALGLRDRGMKRVSRSDRGGLSLWAGAAPAALVEPFFGSNKDDCQRFDERRQRFIKAINDACIEFTGL